MPTKTSAVPSEIYQLKVTLLGAMPPIWRRLLVPADLTLAQLHDVLQSAMGWQDCHMHEFSAGHRHFGKPNPEYRLTGMPPVENERTVRLSSVLSRAGAKAIYTYDMATVGSTASCWRSVYLLTPARSIRSAPAANALAHRRIAGASPDFMSC